MHMLREYVPWFFLNGGLCAGDDKNGGEDYVMGFDTMRELGCKEAKPHFKSVPVSDNLTGSIVKNVR